MTTSRRLGAYALGFVALFSVFFFATDRWRQLDYLVYSKVYLDDPGSMALPSELLLIDIPHPQTQTPEMANNVAIEVYRKRIVDFLGTVAGRAEGGERADAVVLDFYFRNQDSERATLATEIERLIELNVRVYAVFNTRALETISIEDRENDHARELYRLFDGGKLHTQITNAYGVLIYRSELVYSREDGTETIIEALPKRVARDLDDDIAYVENQGYVLPVGEDKASDSNTYVYSFRDDGTSGGRFTHYTTGADATIDLDDKILLVGSLAEDQPMGLPIAGPKVVAWALDDQMAFNRNARQPLDSPGVILAEIIVFALLVVLLFALLFKYVKALQTRPVLLALFSFLGGAVALFGVALGLLTQNIVTPVGLPLGAMLIAAVLSWLFAYRYLVTGAPEGSGKYDVFISYSRADGDWVVKELYEPLQQLRKADGSELSIFFDRDAIAGGEAFTPKYMWAIVDAKHFIPVFSHNYYGPKSHGRNEMDLAYKRAVEKKLNVLPITHGFDAVPEIYTHLNFIDVSEQDDFLEMLKKSILAEEPHDG